MPQLDLYMFTYQLHVFGFFYFIIYIYLRGIVIPNISTVIKYRTKFSEILRSKNLYFLNFFENSNIKVLNKMLTRHLKISETINKNILLTKYLLKCWTIYFVNRKWN